jgi:hypothetical protein
MSGGGSERGNDVARQSVVRPSTEADDSGDIGDPSDWESLASSETHGPMGLEYRITFTPEEARLVARAEDVGNLDVFASAKRAVLDAAHAILEHVDEAVPTS